MYRPGHHGAVMLLYAPVGGVLAAQGHELLGLCGALFVFSAAMVPDIDRRVGWLRRRGPTHTVWFALAFGAATALAASVVFPYLFGLGEDLSLAAGFALGTFVVVVHLVGDALTPAGVRPFAPLVDWEFAVEMKFASDAPGNYALLGVGLLAIGVAFLLGGSIAG